VNIKTKSCFDVSCLSCAAFAYLHPFGFGTPTTLPRGVQSHKKGADNKRNQELEYSKKKGGLGIVGALEEKFYKKTSGRRR
jgi:hypothetical protein